MEAKEDFIEVGNIKLFYKFISPKLLHGSNPLLIFLHEGLGSVAQWKDFPEQLCEITGCPGFLYDREGHGKSSMLQNKRNNDFMQIQAKEVLPEVLEKLNIETTNKILIGHSDGGSIAIIYAGAYPDKLKGVITEAAHVIIEYITQEGLKDAVTAFKTTKLKELLQKYHGDKTDTMFYGWADTWLSEDFLNWNIIDSVKKIKVPYQVIQGDNDQYGSVEQLNTIKINCNKSQVELIENCGHIPHNQQREVILNKMAEFIKIIK